MMRKCCCGYFNMINPKVVYSVEGTIPFYYIRIVVVLIGL